MGGRLTAREASIARPRALALLLPLALLAGAWGSQLIGHLYPCEMCHWQRWPQPILKERTPLCMQAVPRRPPKPSPLMPS